MKSFTGAFETTGVATSFFSAIAGTTKGFDSDGLSRPAAWQGQTTGWGAGVGKGAIFWSRSIYGNPRMR